MLTHSARGLGVVAVAGALCVVAGTRAATARSTGHACSSDAVASVVRSFLSAYSAGNAAAVDRLFAREPAFQWFSMRGPQARLGRKAYDRSTIRAYVLRRHRHHERLTEVLIQGNLRFILVRSADDYGRHQVEGKGDVRCAGGTAKLIVWSI
jgi:hypothetical protein